MAPSGHPIDPETDPDVRPSKLTFPVVGIGTSAGGLGALQRLLDGLPSQPGVAIVIVMHLSPKHESSVDQILQRHTAMRVTQVVEPVPLRVNEVYIISPRKALSMNDGYLRLVDLERPFGRHVAIDYFFRTLAEVHRERAIAVILTGSGSDGSVGIARVRERGGVTLAQAPLDAEFDEMPRSAIATGAVDIVLPLMDMPDRLLSIAREASHMTLPLLEIRPDDALNERPAEVGNDVDEEALRDIMLVLRAKTGHDFRSYKRATVLRRIERRMQVNGLQTLQAYRDFIRDNAWERPALLKDMLISVTNFFRDREAFEALERDILPQLLAPEPGEHHIRAWAAGCATGEEAYSMAMLLIEATAGTGASVQVFGTDIDEDAIAFARQGAYPAAVAADIPPSRVSRFLQKDDNTYRVSKQLREAVLFARHNVLQDPPFSKLDIISCRNLLIYLNRDIQSRVLETFHFALKPGGFLILGTSESADSVSRLFTPVDKKNRIYRANAAASSGVIVRRTAQPAAERDERAAEPLRVPPMLANRKHRSLRDVHDDALRDFLPPSILVDKDGVIVNMSDSASDYLRLSGGTPSLQINTLIVPELRLELRTSLFQAVQGGRAVRSRAVGWGGRDEGVSVSLEVRPIHDKDSDVTYYLVVFQQGSALALPQGAADPEETPILLQLEEELKRAKEQLQTTLEESEASSEELKASNEELQSINEELRSATEELETSKEELQSINEELITVNHELKLKVDETAKINDDLQNLVASTDIATVFVDRDMCVKGFTPQAAEVFRLIAGDVGRPLLDLNHRLDYPELAADATQAFHALRISEREVGSGDGRWYIARVLPYRTAQDRIEGAVLTFIDITRRHEAEIAARASEERMRLVADSALDYAIITMDPDGIITSWSRGAEKIFGYTGAEAMGQSGELIYTPEDRGAAVFSRELGVARGEGRAHDDRWHQRSDGERIFCSGITTPLHQGGFHGFAKIARDMTIEKQREREREELLRAEKASRERAQSAVQLKDEFLAVMSHELKHPLNLIMMNAELIGRSPSTQDDPGVRRLAGTIRKTVEGQARIIDDLLDLSRLNTGKMALTIVPVNVSECVRQVAEGMHEEMHRRRIQLHLTLPEQDLHMKADRIRVEQVVWNLLSNAVKFCKDEGHVIVTLAVAGARAVLTVADDGIGMAPDKIARVFNMFDQGASRRDGGTRGLGIGLALVKQLVELHGGEVDAHSDGPGRGATFTVSMPITEATAEAAPIEASAEPASTSLKGLSILIVDDSDELLGPFRQLLTMEGAEVSLASSGEAALERMGQQRFDVVLSDIGMPGMDGHELIRRIRASEHGDHVIAIAVTGFGRQQDATKAKAAGFDAHLSKPVSMRVLVDTISSLRSN